MTVEQAYTRYVLRVDSTLPQDDLAPPLDDAAIELGAVYHSAAVAPSVADPAAPPLDDPRAPSGRLGARLPHVPVTWKGAPASLLDVATDGLVLLAGPEGGAWVYAADAVAQKLGVGLCGYRVGADLVADAQAFTAAVGIGPGGVVLVRPDGVLAWSAAEPVADPVDAVAAVARQVLCRD
jgi:hypothetical protein